MNAEKLLPQFDRAAIETPIGFFKTLFRLHEIGRECVIPAIVEEYDSASGIVKVRPLAKSVSQDAEGKEVLADRPLYSVHAVRSMHGGVIVESTLYKGDTGWLIASDRNCKDAIAENSTILEGDQSDDEPQNKGASRPTDNSLASFAWGFFIPDSWAGNEPQGEGIGIIDRLKRFGIRITRGFAKLFGVGGSVTVGEDGIDIDGTTSFSGDAIFEGRTIFGDTELGVKKMTFGKGKEPVHFLATNDVECGAVLSDKEPLGVVTSSESASAGVAEEAARQDHVHKMPPSVVLTNVNQNIPSLKTIMPGAGSSFANLAFKIPSAPSVGWIRFGKYQPNEFMRLFLQSQTFANSETRGNIIIGIGNQIYIGGQHSTLNGIDDVRLGFGANRVLDGTSPTTSGNNRLRVANVGWVTKYFTPGDGTLTIKQGLKTLGTFTANQSTNQEINIPQGGGDVTVKGTDNSTHTGNSFTLKSASNSNVTAVVDSYGNITLGVYYV